MAHGGTRPGAGRKKGSGYGGVSSLIKKHVDDFMSELIKDKRLDKCVKKDLIQLSITSGWIYLIKDLDSEEYKVGVTQKTNPKQRLSQYVSHKMNIELIFIENIEDCFELEEDICIALDKKRVRGDWFKLNDSELIEVIHIINEHKYKGIHDGRWKKK